LPGRGHAERPVQGSWWQEHGAAHAGGPRAQQARKLETRALFAGSQGGTVARAGRNTYAPLSARLDLRPPWSRGRIRTTLDHLSQRHRWQWQGCEPIECVRARLALVMANKPCRGAAMPNGRCKVHGGKSTGPRTPEGLERSRRANWKHGHFSREAKAERSRVRAAILAIRYVRMLGLGH
jgi:hypothetical protein